MNGVQQPLDGADGQAADRMQAGNVGHRLQTHAVLAQDLVAEVQPRGVGLVAVRTDAAAHDVLDDLDRDPRHVQHLAPLDDLAARERRAAGGTDRDDVLDELRRRLAPPGKVLGALLARALGWPGRARWAPK